MKLINWDGAIFGPGSEWFWSMLQFIVVAITLYAIYRQLRLQLGEGAIAQATHLQDEWHASERLVRSRLAVLVSVRDGVDPGLAAPAASSDISNFWERVGFLVRAGYIDTRLVHEYFSNSVRLWWAWLTPAVMRWRQREEDPLLNEHFEWLARAMAELDRKTGSRSTYDEAHLATQLPSAIAGSIDAIRVAEELRAVIVRPMSTATLAPETTAS